jgi:hypothetical protein
VSKDRKLKIQEMVLEHRKKAIIKLGKASVSVGGETGGGKLNSQKKTTIKKNEQESKDDDKKKVWCGMLDAVRSQKIRNLF